LAQLGSVARSTQHPFWHPFWACHFVGYLDIFGLFFGLDMLRIFIFPFVVVTLQMDPLPSFAVCTSVVKTPLLALTPYFNAKKSMELTQHHATTGCRVEAVSLPQDALSISELFELTFQMSLGPFFSADCFVAFRLAQGNQSTGLQKSCF